MDAKRRPARCRRSRTAFLLAAAAAFPAASRAANVTVDPGTAHQTMTGWEAVAWAGDTATAAFHNYKLEVYDRAVNEVGVNRVRLEVRSGCENDADYWTQQRQGVIDYPTWRSYRYSTVNDNADPGVINGAGFHFSEMDDAVVNVVLPVKELVEANGEALHVNLCYVAFTAQIGGGLQYIHDDPAEYAEFVLATFRHLQETYGFVPDTWEVILEPDNVSQWNGTLVGQAILTAAARLEADGFTPRFVAPSNTNMGNAVSYFDAMVPVMGAQGIGHYVQELCYHRYGGVSAANLQAISDRGVLYGIGTSMLEWWSSGNTYHTLHEDIDAGRNSSWERGVFSGTGTVTDDTAKLYVADVTDPGNPNVMMNNGTKFIRQYFKFVRMGAVRIGAGSDDGSFAPLAFVNTDGGCVVVVKAAAGGAFSVQGLPAASYGVKYTTSGEYDVDHPDVIIGAGQALDTSIPAAGVITVYARSAPAKEEPVCSVSADETTILEGGQVSFTAAASDPDGGGIQSYEWDFSYSGAVFNQEGTGDAIQHTFAAPGMFAVAARVTDDEGATAVATVVITVWADADGDGMPDWWESKYSLDPGNASDATQDADGDGLDNLTEWNAGTNPRDEDTDGDGIPDADDRDPLQVPGPLHGAGGGCGAGAAALAALALLSVGRRRRASSPSPRRGEGGGEG